MSKRISIADMAVNAALVLLSAAAAVLLCIYLFGGRATADDPQETIPPHIINASETEAVQTTVTTTTETTVISEEAAVTESEPEPEIGVYSPAFFGKTLFIGDSLSVGLINYEFLPPENVFAKAGITPVLAADTRIDNKSVFDKARDIDPEYICILLGTNGIAYVEGQQMSAELGDFIDMIAKTCPNAKIAIASVPPVTQKHEAEKPEQLEAIIAYNEFVKQVAEDKSVAFADVFTLLEDETGYLGPRYAEHDGLHLKIHAYPVILGAFQNALIGYYDIDFVPPPETEPAVSAAVTVPVSAGTASSAATDVPAESVMSSEIEEEPEAEEDPDEEGLEDTDEIDEEEELS
ncbi:MAG: hypothetical protein K2K34_03470 [Oscillospiraceae bacterium]|nr:hypothetical protein [Oscillospiraceae bacterium]